MNFSRFVSQKLRICIVYIVLTWYIFNYWGCGNFFIMYRKADHQACYYNILIASVQTPGSESSRPLQGLQYVSCVVFIIVYDFEFHNCLIIVDAVSVPTIQPSFIREVDSLVPPYSIILLLDKLILFFICSRHLPI